MNIAPPSSEATWFKLVGVKLDNGAGDYPNGDEVQTVVPWDPPKTWANLSNAQLNAALTDIDKGLANGQRYSCASAAKERHAWIVVKRRCPDKTEVQCREMVRTWIGTGLLCNELYDDPVDPPYILAQCRARRTSSGHHAR